MYTCVVCEYLFGINLIAVEKQYELVTCMPVPVPLHKNMNFLSTCYQLGCHCKRTTLISYRLSLATSKLPYQTSRLLCNSTVI